jgi:hypothetical protein
MTQTYGATKEKAEAFAAYMRELVPHNRFEVQMYDHSRNVYGVVRYTPFCQQVPWRCSGFIWRDYSKPLEEVRWDTQ